MLPLPCGTSSLIHQQQLPHKLPPFPSMAIKSKRRNSDTDLLHDLESLNQHLHPPNVARRNPSFTLPTSPDSGAPLNPQRLPLHLSSSNCQQPQVKDQIFTTIPIEKTRGFFNWKPIRMLTHIGKRRITCFFSVEVIAIRNLPESMNGLRLSVGIRKGDSREGSVRALPSRVLQGSAEFAETLFVHCNVYCSGGAAAGKPVKLEPRPFVISAIAVDSPEIELGSSFIDLSQLIRESSARSLEGFRIQVWDAALELAGKAEGGNLVLRIGFQVLDDGGVGIYSRGIDQSRGFVNSSTAKGRRQSKNSFSISTLDSRVRKMPFFELPEEEEDYFKVSSFRTLNNGGEASIEAKKESIPYTEVVKGVIHNKVEKQIRLVELNSIANEIKDLESTMSKTMITSTSITEKSRSEQLDDSEQSVTKEFLQMLDNEANNYKELKAGKFMEEKDHGNQETMVLLPDLGNGLGPVIQTKDGGFLASMNPFKVEMFRKETPKLAAQISKPLIIQVHKLASGFEIFQCLASADFEKLFSKFSMDEIQGKTAEQIAFEGIASVIINGRNREGATCSASKSLASVKRLTTAMSNDRKERILNEIQSAEEETKISIENILAFTMQKMEEIALEALKIHADMAEEDASSVVSRKEGADSLCEVLLDSIISIDDWLGSCEDDDGLTVLVAIQLRDPFREFEAVGAPIITLTQVIREKDGGEDDEERRYNMTGIHAGGKKGARIGEKSKLTASQWLVANGVGKMGKKKSRTLKSKLQEDVLWSLSSRVMEDMMLSTVRNPDVKVCK